ncbi:MAG: sulfate adenylyltransferase [Chloroflexi bacterium]|nr:sulfate adenylyltransferase [Chloroflexota bacterium]MYD48835.1 sulfate adenylyltransferase [Chloroflexota bacterium]
MTTGVDNSLSPHGGVLVQRVRPRPDANELARLPTVGVREQIAHECVNIAYGFFSPLTGFMGSDDVASVAQTMRLTNGYVWPIPIVLDLASAELQRAGISVGDTVLLTHQGNPLATLDVSDIFAADLTELARHVYATTDPAHPGVQRTLAYADRFVAGDITLVCQPVISPPFDRYWRTPAQLRDELSDAGWQRAVAHQTRNVPHSGHEYLMKGAFMEAGADGVLVSAVIGEKKIGDYIDEAIVLAHDNLRAQGFFRDDIHRTTALLWDMRYAGPREAVFHALVRKNLGCTHHMFGRDHAGVGDYYDRYAAHDIFSQLPDLGIRSVLTLEWWYCPTCYGVAYEGICGHPDAKQDLAGRLIRSIIDGGSEPAPQTLRAETLAIVRQCADQYGFGSPFVTEQYLRQRTPVLTVPPSFMC